jgi:hypothetical protein
MVNKVKNYVKQKALLIGLGLFSALAVTYGAFNSCQNYKTAKNTEAINITLQDMKSTQDSIYSALKSVDSTTYRLDSIISSVANDGALKTIPVETYFQVQSDSLALKKGLDTIVYDSITNPDLVDHIAKNGSLDSYVVDSRVKKEEPVRRQRSSHSARRSTSKSKPVQDQAVVKQETPLLHGYQLLTDSCETCLAYEVNGTTYFIDQSNPVGVSAALIQSLDVDSMFIPAGSKTNKTRFGSFTATKEDLELSSRMISDTQK